MSRLVSIIYVAKAKNLIFLFPGIKMDESERDDSADTITNFHWIRISRQLDPDLKQIAEHISRYDIYVDRVVLDNNMIIYYNMANTVELKVRMFPNNRSTAYGFLGGLDAKRARQATFLVWALSKFVTVDLTFDIINCIDLADVDLHVEKFTKKWFPLTVHGSEFFLRLFDPTYGMRYQA